MSRGGNRDFRAELRGHRCWDAGVQELYEATGEPAVDCILQNREELIALCRFIEANRVRSYLEIGVWTGRLLSVLHRLFGFDRVAGCDDGYAQRLGLPLTLPSDARFYQGDSASPGFARFRRQLGAVDLVLIDGNHRYAGVRADLERERLHPHRFLALHDITGANRHTAGVGRLWGEIRGGEKIEILEPHRELGLDHSVMGIGICGRGVGAGSTPARG